MTWVKKKRILGAMVLALVLSFLPWKSIADPIEKTYENLRIFAQVLSFVQNNYVDEVDSENLIHDALRGLLRSLDPHTVYMTPEEYQKTQEDTSGAYGGLGIGINQDDRMGFIIHNVSPDSPGANAGLQRGDQLLAVDNVLVKNLSLSQLASKIRGLPDTQLTLTVMREGWTKAREILLVRKRVQINSVKHQILKPGFGYVAIRSFQENTVLDLKTALKKLKQQNKQMLKGLILDLRDNPGGLFDQGVAVADHFIDRGKIVITDSRHERHREIQPAHAEDTEKSLPLVVLVNRHTASSSEIVAGALKAHKRAHLMGENTYGKGSVQTLIGLDDGSGLKLTVARYKTPDGLNIPASGIAPDSRLPQSALGQEQPKKDPWVQEALKHLETRSR